MDFSTRKRFKSVPSRISSDTPCPVCEENSAGKHYGVICCIACAQFFKRCKKYNRKFVCIEMGGRVNQCVLQGNLRTECSACRLRKCLEVGMRTDDQPKLHSKTLLSKNSVSHLKSVSALSTTENEMANDNTTPSTTSHISSYVSSESITSSPNAKNNKQVVKSLPMVNSTSMPISVLSHQTQPLNLVRDTHPTHSEEVIVDVPSMVTWNFMFENICELAARLLFMNIRWAKSVPSFNTLPNNDKIILLKECWRELFVLSAAQFTLPIETSTLMINIGSNFEYPGFSGVITESQVGLVKEISSFQETVAKIKKMNVDQTEYAFLRFIILFNSTAGLQDIQSSMNSLYHGQLMLSQYVSAAYPDQPQRRVRLLLLLPALRVIAESTIEDLYFRKTIGQTTVKHMMSDMFNSSFL